MQRLEGSVGVCGGTPAHYQQIYIYIQPIETRLSFSFVLRAREIMTWSSGPCA